MSGMAGSIRLALIGVGAGLMLVAVETPPLSAQAPGPRALAAGGRHNCLLDGAGAAYCWGDNADGQLGRGADAAREDPQLARAVGGLSFSSIVAGWHHTCALQHEGTTYCWGRGNDGQLGNGAAESSPVPVVVAGDQKFTMVTAGESHTCALTADGRAFCWGKRNNGRLGVGRDTPDCARGHCLEPAEVRAPEPLQWITAGNAHTCAVGKSGQGYCWGDGSAGRLGGGNERDAHAPIPVESEVRFRAVTAGDQHTCGLSVDGLAYCWGFNQFAQVGNGESGIFKRQRTPGPVMGTHLFASLHARGDITCGLTEGGEPLCWGHNTNGQLGPMVEDRKEQTEPAAASRVSFTALAAGPNHVCGISSAGGLHCWGDFGHGRLGYTKQTAGGGASPLTPRPLPERAQLAAATAAGRGNPLAPSGLPLFDERIRRVLAAQQPDSITASVGFRVPGAPQDDVIWSLYQGTALHYAGRFRESNQALQRAVQLTESQGGRSLSNLLIAAVGASERGSTLAGLAALTASNRPLPFRLSAVEQGMVSYYSALNFLQSGDLAGAAGEAHRLLSILGERDPAAADGSTVRIRAMLAYFAGAVLEAAGDRSNSDVAYQAARQMDPAGELPAARPPARGAGEVVLMVERGFVAHRVATTIEVPLSEAELAELSTGPTSDRLKVAFPIARQVESFLSSQPSGGLFHPGNGSALRFGRGAVRGGTTLQVPWPVLRSDPGSATLAGTIVASRGPTTAIGPAGNLTEAVAADLMARRDFLLALSLSRSAMNLAADRRTQARASGPVTLGNVVGGIASILATNDRADTRAWHLIPGEMAVVRLQLPAGTQRLVLKQDHGGGSGSDVDLGSIEVKEGETAIVARRIWQ